jgi:hypothetical protein
MELVPCSTSTGSTWYQVQEDIFNWHRREIFPEESGPKILKYAPLSSQRASVASYC